jgi:hypothetical protein
MPLTRLLYWNGQDLPEGLRDLPPGAYTIEPVKSDKSEPTFAGEDYRPALAAASWGGSHSRGLEQVRPAIEPLVGVVDQPLANGGDLLDDEERAELHRELEASIGEADAGETHDLAEFLAKLRQRERGSTRQEDSDD